MLRKINNVKAGIGGLTLNHKDYILTLKRGLGDLTLNAYSIKGIFNVKSDGCLTLRA